MNPQVKYFEELKNNHQNLTPRETVHSGLSDPQESFVTPESYPPPPGESKLISYNICALRRILRHCESDFSNFESPAKSTPKMNEV